MGDPRRGYGYAHERRRAQIQARIDLGEPIACWRCGAPIVGRAWDLGHDDYDRSVYRGAECIKCNRGAAARKVNAMRRAKRHGYTSREW